MYDLLEACIYLSEDELVDWISNRHVNNSGPPSTNKFLPVKRCGPKVTCNEGTHFRVLDSAKTMFFSNDRIKVFI